MHDNPVQRVSKDVKLFKVITIITIVFLFVAFGRRVWN
jgi:hypothetical protein